jgi:hypothetical protein
MSDLNHADYHSGVDLLKQFLVLLTQFRLTYSLLFLCVVVEAILLVQEEEYCVLVLVSIAFL